MPLAIMDRRPVSFGFARGRPTAGRPVTGHPARIPVRELAERYKQTSVRRTTNVCLEGVQIASSYRLRTCGAPTDDAQVASARNRLQKRVAAREGLVGLAVREQRETVRAAGEDREVGLVPSRDPPRVH